MPPGITSTVGEPRALDREYNERRERIGRDPIRVIVQTQIHLLWAIRILLKVFCTWLKTGQ